MSDDDRMSDTLSAMHWSGRPDGHGTDVAPRELGITGDNIALRDRGVL